MGPHIYVCPYSFPHRARARVRARAGARVRARAGARARARARVRASRDMYCRGGIPS